MPSSISQARAIALALAGYTLWVLADTSLKYVGASRLPAYEVIAVLGLTMVVLLLLYALARGGMGRLWPRQPARQIARALLEVGNNLCVVIALRHLPLALFYILIFLAPLVTTLAAASFLHEKLGWRQALAILVGFAGVLIAVGPIVTRPGEWIGYAACMVCVSCFSANLVWSRVITRTETPESLVFFSGLVLFAVGGLAMLWHAVAVPPLVAVILVATGILGLLGSLCFFAALKHTTAANVSQYHYSQLVTGALLAWLIWGEGLTHTMLFGAVLIVAAGLYTAAQAYRQTTVTSPPAPPPAAA